MKNGKRLGAGFIALLILAVSACKTGGGVAVAGKPAAAIRGQADARFIDPQWTIEGEVITSAYIGDTVTIRFETKDISDNEIIPIEIWEITDGKLTDFIGKTRGEVKNGVVETEWDVDFDEENEKASYAKEIKEKNFAFLDYAFVINYKKASAISGELAVLKKISRRYLDVETKKPLKNVDYIVFTPDGQKIEGKTDADGYLKIDNLRAIGNYKIRTSQEF